ncbi:MAG TPA: TIR domain-containing protein, partial [Ktedonobacterales bacterium]
MAANPAIRTRAFVSYSHKDEQHLQRLHIHLKPYIRDHKVDVWDDTHIAPGTNWHEEIEKGINSAKVAIFLVSADFLASEFIALNELPPLLEAAIHEGTQILSVILSPCAFKQSPLAQYQTLNDPNKPLISLSKGKREEIWVKLGEHVAEALKQEQVTSVPAAKPQKQEKPQGESKKVFAAPAETAKSKKAPPQSQPPKRKPAQSSKVFEEYYRTLDDYSKRGIRDEEGLRPAFFRVLESSTRTGWRWVLERRVPNRRKPDGTLFDEFNLPRGYWEAKDPQDDLETEIRKKIKDGYPLTNIIFEDTQRAVLYQHGKRVMEGDLRQPRWLADLLQEFLTYTEPAIESFQEAVAEFKDRIPDLARGLLSRIREEYSANTDFIQAFKAFHELCKEALNPQLNREHIEEMLVQHLLTERLFRTVFNNSDFTNRNVIAVEIEKVISALTSRTFDRADFAARLDRFYKAIERAAKDIT